MSTRILSNSARYLGVMSGTSLDGIDVALLCSAEGKHKIEATGFSAYDAKLRAASLELCVPGPNELARANALGIELADRYADVILDVLAKSNVNARDVRAIGCHGQTVRHMPQEGYSVQVLNGARLAERCGIDVICDFRSRDLAAGGQGAPLVPAFHAAVFSENERHRVVVNIGGIANITNLPRDKQVSGFDCGPGNVFLDLWTQRHLGKSYDADGAWAANGHVIDALLAHLLTDDYFKLAPPKSTGREYFNAHWLDRHLTGKENVQDVQATLTLLTVETIAASIEAHAQASSEIYVCGGGARNSFLMRQLQQRLQPRVVASTASVGIHPDFVEAAAFAWLAEQWVLGTPGNLAAVTGAKGPRILGCCYPA